VEQVHGIAQLDAAQLRRVVEIQRELVVVDLPTRELYRLVAERAMELTGVDGALVEEVDGRELVYVAAVGSMAGFEGERLPIDGTVSGLAVRTRTPQISRDVTADPRTDAVYAARFGLESFCAVPLSRYGDVAAVLIVVSRYVNGVDDQTLELLSMMADLIGARLAHAMTLDALAQRTAAHDHVRQALQRQAEEVSALASARHAVLAGDDARQAVVDAALEVSGAAIVGLVEPQGEDALVVTASAGANITGLRIALNETSLVAAVWRSRQARISTDLRAEPLSSGGIVDRLEALLAQRLGGAAYIPLTSAEGSLGVLVAAWPVGPTDSVRLQLLGVLEILAQEAAIAVEREDLRRRLSLLASTDPLTGLANRRRWDDWLTDELRRSRRSGTPFSIGLLDLDRFKEYNDTYGHGAGDALLATCASAWSAQLRETDLIARYGGEEFVVGLPGCSLEDATLRLERLRRAMPGAETCSIGVAAWDGKEPVPELLARADTALYAAKAAGRNRVIAQPSG
jgi:diguanylate cyclase (GGDEF)-like protein